MPEVQFGMAALGVARLAAIDLARLSTRLSAACQAPLNHDQLAIALSARINYVQPGNTSPTILYRPRPGADAYPEL